VNDTLKAFCILDREHLLTNTEKAARSLNLWHLVAQNTPAKLWELAHAAEEPDPETSSMVGSEPVLEILTEDPPGGQRPGVRPTVKHTRAKR
jgi:hypothetical protein